MKRSFVIIAALSLAATLLQAPSSARTPEAAEQRPAARAAVVRSALETLQPLSKPASSTAPADATMALRDLAYARQHLSGRDLEIANGILARPTDSTDPYGQFYGPGITASSRCYDVFCLTWASQGTDAPNMTDSDGDGVPDWVVTTRETVSHVLETYAAAGLRAPLPDFGAPDNGTSTAFDIYLADLGADGLYGYCVPDVDNHERTTPAYCVLDNDFSSAEFGGTPTLTLGVTAAHEILHAVQFAYDATEAPWFLESLATFVEDELYDASNDSDQYLRLGPIGRPTVSLDDPDPFGGNRYGAWVFWRYLSESLGQPGLAVIRSVLQSSGVGGAQPDLDALKAARRYVESRPRASWPSVFTDFVLANRRPAAHYSEGGRYPAAPTQRTFILTKRTQTTKRRVASLGHLSAYHVDVRPGRGIKGAWTVQVSVDTPPRFKGVRAVVSVRSKSGAVRVTELPTNAQGKGAKRYTFNPAQVSKVTLTLVNTGTRYDCDPRLLTDFSCGGSSLDDGRRVRYSMAAFRRR